MKLQPYKKKLLVRPDPDATITKGGIHIVETRKTERAPTKIGTVIRAGESDLAAFKPGDRVLYTPDVMSPVEVEEIVGMDAGDHVYDKLVLIRDSDVLGVFE